MTRRRSARRDSEDTLHFAREAWPFVLPWWALSILVGLLGELAWSTFLALAGLATLLFFRDPERSCEGPPRDLVAPADGKVLAIEEAASGQLGGERFRRVITFLSAFDVHVQRCPTGGEVLRTEYTPGAKVAAFRRDAGEVNQRLLTLIRTTGGDIIGVQQIAGLMARRVVGYLEAGDRVERGQHLGLIKFGSRVDLLVPLDYEIRVRPADRVRAGETIMASPPGG